MVARFDMLTEQKPGEYVCESPKRGSVELG